MFDRDFVAAPPATNRKQHRRTFRHSAVAIGCLAALLLAGGQARGCFIPYDNGVNLENLLFWELFDYFRHHHHRHHHTDIVHPPGGSFTPTLSGVLGNGLPTLDGSHGPDSGGPLPTPTPVIPPLQPSHPVVPGLPPPAVVPEPASATLLGIAALCGGLGYWRRRRAA